MSEFKGYCTESGKKLLTAISLAALALIGGAADGEDEVKTWGVNRGGQLGIGSYTSFDYRTTPVTLTGLASVVGIMGSGPWAGSSFSGGTFLIMSDGRVKACGANFKGELGVGNAGIYQAAGDYYTVISPSDVPGLSGVIAIASSANLRFSLFLRNDGTVWASGCNDKGELGNGTTAGTVTPVAIPGLSNVVQVSHEQTSDSTWHGIAVLADGTVKRWGEGVLTPQPMTGFSNVKKYLSGYSHSAVLFKDGHVEARGLNDHGQLGDGSPSSYTYRQSFGPVTGLSSGVVDLAAGKHHYLAVLSDGTVRAWGANGSGQLGDGSTTDRFTPVSVTGLTNVTATAAGDEHSLALLRNGSVRAWGNNTYGQIGDGTRLTNRLVSVAVSGLSSNVVAISAGPNHSLALQPPGGNLAPSANAGIGGVVTLPGVANLHGYATDDGKPVPPGSLSVTWSKVNGPGTVAFGVNQAETVAGFSRTGAYVLQMTADDGAMSSSSTVEFLVIGSNPGDTDGDGFVTAADLQMVITNFGKTYPILP